jgi:hypothetical protein
LEYYTKSLELDPTMWCSFERMCKLLQSVNPANIFVQDHPFMQKLNANLIGPVHTLQKDMQMASSPQPNNLVVLFLLNNALGSLKNSIAITSG